MFQEIFIRIIYNTIQFLVIIRNIYVKYSPYGHIHCKMTQYEQTKKHKGIMYNNGRYIYAIKGA